MRRDTINATVSAILRGVVLDGPHEIDVTHYVLALPEAQVRQLKDNSKAARTMLEAFGAVPRAADKERGCRLRIDIEESLCDYFEVDSIDEIDQAMLDQARQIYGYIIDLDERGEFRASVRDLRDEIVFEIEGFEIFEDGFMRHRDDIDGLHQHLITLGILPKDSELVSGYDSEFQKQQIACQNSPLPTVENASAAQAARSTKRQRMKA